MDEVLTAGDQLEWRNRLETMLAEHRRRRAERAATRAHFAEARRRGLEARHAERLALLDREARTAEITAYWAEQDARAARRSRAPAASGTTPDPPPLGGAAA